LSSRDRMQMKSMRGTALQTRRREGYIAVSTNIAAQTRLP
jgi:hypothetical protein